MVHYAEPGKKPKWGYFPSEGHPDVVTSFEGTRATPEFLQVIAYEVYVKNVTFGLLHQWLIYMGITISKNTLRNWLKKGKTYLKLETGLCIEVYSFGKRFDCELRRDRVKCVNTITIRSATFGFWSTRPGKQPFSSMRMARVVVQCTYRLFGRCRIEEYNVRRIQLTHLSAMS